MSVQGAARWLLAIGVALLGLHWYPARWSGSALVHDLYANLSTSLLSISITVLLIDRLYEQRDARQLRKRLIWEMGSTDQAIATRATKELRDAKWLADGSLREADLVLANLEGARLGGADLARADLTSANLAATDLTRTTLDGAVLDGCAAARANFKGARLVGARLKGARMTGANFDDADLSGEVDLLTASLDDTSFRGAVLTGARLEEADLLNCDLSHADLSEAVLHRANLDQVDLTGANLERADLLEVENWRAIRSVTGARVSGLRNAPAGFRTWALQNGAVE
ncbi:pentapeptide repeat-containing protein [Micromonospora echinofusca]|uniref:Pentapeptide repeat-containing protein n=1 Tax=Micromonospora echinofusca TaxID=47858 RepID=A0ABS3W0L7_MICEH|nr:pentapeptide repeat-containing protein [Micromonospora echinofusca]MBO4210336.1 hypothetical protein [Micromonospora echinofusca]